MLISSHAVATAPVGATPGELEITTRGSAHYTVPIVVPPGTRGMLPKLSLVYDNQAGNGFLGHGWSLGGLSVIHRCGATILLDGFKGGVKYDGNDRFCLDGERLVNIGGNEYHTRHETFQRVTPSDTSANPSSFTVHAKDGYILEFGVTEDSRIQAQGSTNVRVWALNKMTDRLGNFYTIKYQEDNANGDYRPERIDYTGNTTQGLTPYNSVVFQYEARSDTPPRYEAGGAMKTMQRMSHVLSYTGTTLVRDYRLTYDNSGVAGRSRLTSAQECGTDGVCLPATQFGWQNGALGYSNPINFFWSTNKTGDAPFGFADINGDGKLDFYGWSSDGNVYVRLWGANGFGPNIATSWSTNKTANAPIGFADINGDGRADFWGWSSDGNIYMRMSNGDGTFAPAATIAWSASKSDAPIGFADIDGDGRADFWGWSANGNFHVRLSNGDGSFGADVVTNRGSDPGVRFSFADVNGDGKADLIGERFIGSGTVVGTLTCGSINATAVRYERRNVVRMSNGDGSFGAELPVMSWYAYYDTSGKPLCTDDRMPIGDINGDGNADVFAWLSKGNGAFVAPPTSFFPTTGGSLPPSAGLADVNGDGKDDYYYWDPSSGNVYVRLSSGDNSFATGFSIPWGSYPSNGPVGFADINGDGIADLYGWRSDGNIQVRLGTPTMPDLIVSVTNGLGEQRQLTYKPLTDEIFHQPASVQTYPYRAVQDATYVVVAAGKSDGLGGMASTSYAYGGQMRHLTANDRLGFLWIQRVEPDGSWINDYYNQDADTFGTLVESMTFVPNGTANGVMVKHVTNNWQLGTVNDNRIMLRLFGSVEESYELNGSLVTRATTTTDYDNLGYPITTVVNQSDGRKKTTVNTYLHQSGVDWTLGLKTLEQVSAEAPGYPPETRTTSYGYYEGFGLLAFELTEPTDTAYSLAKTYGYDIFGNRFYTALSGTGITPRATTQTYDSTGRFPAQTTNALNHSETKEYDTRTGEVTKHTGPNGLTTSWTYDGLGRKEKETRPDATTTTIDYAACGSGCPALAVTRTTATPTGQGARVSYRDVLGREIQTSTQGFNGALIYRTTAYDALGRVSQTSLPYYSGETPRHTVNEHDALNRVKKITAPGNRVTTTVYNGLTTTVTDPLIHSTAIVKDSEGHVTETMDALSARTRSSYDAFGNLVQITDPAGNLTTMRYDKLGRQIEMNDPDRGHWTYAYDVIGQLKSQTDAKGQTITMDYDLLGRMIQRVLPNGKDTGTWTYDTAAKGIGKLAMVSNTDATETYAYDNLGRLSLTTTTTLIDNSPYVTRHTYDAFSRLDTIIYPSTDFTLKHVYDGYGHLSELRQDNAQGTLYWKAAAMDARQRLTSETLGNGLTTTHGYDPLTGDLQTIQTGPSASGTVQNLNYLFDAAGNLSQRTDYNQIALTETFGYDSVNRLTGVTGPASKTYTYVANGNLASKSDVGTYSYSGCARAHAVCSVAGTINTTFSYDANGNMLTGMGRTQTYTAFNKPLTSSKAGQSASYFTYDANFNRIVKTTLATTTAGSITFYIGPRYEKRILGTGAVEHLHYLYAGDRTIALIRQSGTSRPTVTGFWPGNGGANTPVLVFGSGFNPTPGATTVKVNGIAAPIVQVASADFLFFLLPAGNTNGPIQVTTAQGSATSATSFGIPLTGVQITGLWPAQGPVGTMVFVFGSGFVAGQTVSVNQTPAPIVQVLDSSLFFVMVPPGATTGPLKVTTPQGTVASAIPFHVGTAPSAGATTVQYLHADHLGSVDTITDATGALVQRLSYDAFGKRRNPNGTDSNSVTAQTTKGYTAQEHDDEVGLINMKAREYDPLLARFLQPDPKGTAGDPHPYAYANHNPLRYTDPTGTSYVDFFGGRSSFYDNRGVFRNDYVQENMNRMNAHWQQTSRDMWNTVNISRSISSSGSGGIAQTSFNLNWNGGGMNGFVSPYANIGAGPAVGVPSISMPSQPTQPAPSPSVLTGSIGAGASGQLAYLGASISAGKTWDSSGSVCSYATACGRIGFGAAAGGGIESGASWQAPLSNRTDYSGGWYNTKAGVGLFNDASLETNREWDEVAYGRDLFGLGVGAAAGYQGCATRYYGCQ